MKKTVNVWFFVVCMAAMVIAFVVVNAEISESTKTIDAAYQNTNRELTDLKTEKQALKEELETVGTDAFIERQARDQYDYMMPDELRFVISFPEEEEISDPSL